MEIFFPFEGNKGLKNQKTESEYKSTRVERKALNKTQGLNEQGKTPNGWGEVGTLSKPGSLKTDMVGKDVIRRSGKAYNEADYQLVIILPLELNGFKGHLKLEVKFEEGREKKASKKEKAGFLILTLKTEKYKSIKWIIHQTERQVAIKVFSNEGNPAELREMFNFIQAGLKEKGIRLMLDFEILKKISEVPDGRKINLLG